MTDVRLRPLRIDGDRVHPDDVAASVAVFAAFEPARMGTPETTLAEAEAAYAGPRTVRDECALLADVLEPFSRVMLFAARRYWPGDIRASAAITGYFCAGHDDDLPGALRRRAAGARRSVTVRFDKRQAERVGRLLLKFINADPAAYLAKYGRAGFVTAGLLALRLMDAGTAQRGKRSRLDADAIARRVSRGQSVVRIASDLGADVRTVERALKKRRKLLDSTVLGQLSE